MASITDKMAELEGEDEVPQIKLGDASCAAPFTSKLSNVAASECSDRFLRIGVKFLIHLFTLTSCPHYQTRPMHLSGYDSDVQDPGSQLSHLRVGTECAISGWYQVW